MSVLYGQTFSGFGKRPIRTFLSALHVPFVQVLALGEDVLSEKATLRRRKESVKLVESRGGHFATRMRNRYARSVGVIGPPRSGVSGPNSAFVMLSYPSLVLVNGTQSTAVHGR